MTSRRVLLILVAIATTCFAAIVIRRALASDKTRIRWLFADEAAAFNDCSALSALSHFAPDWRDATTGTERRVLQAGLLWLFRNRRDPESQRFLYRIEVGEIDVEVQDERAKASLPLVLHEGFDANEKAIWELRVTAELGKHEGEWRIERSRHETESGSAPR